MANQKINKDPALARLQADIAEHLEAICALFDFRPKVTIIIRTPWLDDGDVVLSDDSYDLAVNALRRLEKSPSAVVTPPTACGRCGIGIDGDGDGHCAVCVTMSDEVAEGVLKINSGKAG